MTAGDSTIKPGPHELATEKLTKVLGRARASEVMGRVLTKLQIAQLRTPEELHRFSIALLDEGGFEGAVGGLLGLQAILLGAKG